MTKAQNPTVEVAAVPSEKMGGDGAGAAAALAEDEASHEEAATAPKQEVVTEDEPLTTRLVRRLTAAVTDLLTTEGVAVTPADEEAPEAVAHEASHEETAAAAPKHDLNC